MLRIAEGTEKLLLNQQPSERAAVSYTQIFVSPYYTPSNKTAPPDSPFCKVLFTKSVVTFRKGHQNSHVKSKQKLLFIYA